MERDDLLVNDSYSVEARHDEEHGRVVRKKIAFVTVVLTVVTIIEVALGIFVKQGTTMWPVVKWLFIAMTIVKAGYIVAVFMHLGDERKSLRYLIIIPYVIFLLSVLYITITESIYLNELWSTYF